MSAAKCSPVVGAEAGERDPQSVYWAAIALLAPLGVIVLLALSSR